MQTPTEFLAGNLAQVGQSNDCNFANDFGDVKPLATLDPDLTLKSQVRMVALQLAKADPVFCARLRQRLEDEQESMLEANLFPLGHLLMASGNGASNRKTTSNKKQNIDNSDSSRPIKMRTKRRRGDSDDDTIDSRKPREGRSKRRTVTGDFTDTESVQESFPSLSRRGRKNMLKETADFDIDTVSDMEPPTSSHGRRRRAGLQDTNGESMLAMPFNGGHSPRYGIETEMYFDLSMGLPQNTSNTDFDALIGQLPSPRTGDPSRWSNGGNYLDENIFTFPDTGGNSLYRGEKRGRITGENRRETLRDPRPAKIREVKRIPRGDAKDTSLDSSTGNLSNISNLSDMQGLGLHPLASSPAMFEDGIEISFCSIDAVNKMNESGEASGGLEVGRTPSSFFLSRSRSYITRPFLLLMSDITLGGCIDCCLLKERILGAVYVQIGCIYFVE